MQQRPFPSLTQQKEKRPYNTMYAEPVLEAYRPTCKPYFKRSFKGPKSKNYFKRMQDIFNAQDIKRRTMHSIFKNTFSIDTQTKRIPIG
jgi:hypothetical protein